MRVQKGLVSTYVEVAFYERTIYMVQGVWTLFLKQCSVRYLSAASMKSNRTKLLLTYFTIEIIVYKFLVDGILQTIMAGATCRYRCLIVRIGGEVKRLKWAMDRSNKFYYGYGGFLGTCGWLLLSTKHDVAGLSAGYELHYLCDDAVDDACHVLK